MGLLTAWQLGSERECPKNHCLGKARQNLLKDVASEVTCCPFCHTLLVKAVTNPLRFKGREHRPSFP